jgi:hypothetical protein
MAFYLLKRRGLLDRFKLNGASVARYLMRIEAGYPENPYHNRRHASHVLQTYDRLLQLGGLSPHYADDVTYLACLLSAVSFEVDV